MNVFNNMVADIENEDTGCLFHGLEDKFESEEFRTPLEVSNLVCCSLEVLDFEV